jgi:hypothetical protein
MKKITENIEKMVFDALLEIGEGYSIDERRIIFKCLIDVKINKLELDEFYNFGLVWDSFDGNYFIGYRKIYTYRFEKIELFSQLLLETLGTEL